MSALVQEVRRLAEMRQEARDVVGLSTRASEVTRLAYEVVGAVVQVLPACAEVECEELHCTCDTAHFFGCECY